MTESAAPRINSLVVHTTRPAWGPGRVLAVRGTKVIVYFRDYPAEDPRTAIKTIDTSLVPLRPARVQSDAILDNLPPYTNGEFVRPVKSRVTLEQGIERFGSRFPLYFEDPAYLGDSHQGERTYKWAAHQKFLDTLGGGLLEELLGAGDIAEVRRRALASEGGTNLLSVFEKAALREALDDDLAAKRFFTRLSDVLRDAQVSESSFQAYLDSVGALPNDPSKSSAAKWTIATILPYLADPTRFMFLKPAVTQACAARLMFNLKYSTALTWVTYRQLMTMAKLLLERLSPYGARDYIDVQSFIWLIGKWEGV